jgi:hypothetical protein
MAYFVFMEMNSKASLKTARLVFNHFGCDWEKVRLAGKRRADGVLVVAIPLKISDESATKEPVASKKRCSLEFFRKLQSW